MRNFTRRKFLAGLVTSSFVGILPIRISYGRNLNQEEIISLDENNSKVDGEGETVFVKKPLVLRAGHYSNIIFSPEKGYLGPGPIFMAKNGKVIHENITISGFSGPGCKVLSESEVGNSFVAIGNCKYSNNGDLKRTTLTAAINMRFASSIEVKDPNIFNPGDFIWVGDGKFKISGIEGNKLLLVMGNLPNIISPMVFSGGYDKCSVGQFVTMNAEDKHGIRIGSGNYGWDIDLTRSKIECNYNAGAGFYHSCKKYHGTQIIENITSIGNGYINIGMSYMENGVIRNCIARDSGNNCIDIFETGREVRIYDNVVSGAGVDGIFVGGDGESAKVYNNDISNCHRMGILVNARNNAISGAFVKDNKVMNSGMNSITLTAVESGEVSDNVFNGSGNRQAIFLEKRKGLSLSGVLDRKNNKISNSSSGDIATNYPGYANDSNATVDINSERKMKVSGIKGY